jgi:hypothetical protein
MPLPVNDPFIEAILERVRSIVAHEPRVYLDTLARTLGVPEDNFRRLVEDREHRVDTALLIDVLAALVREFAIDPQWLLVGKYDPDTHRRALLLIEEQGRAAEPMLRHFVREQITRLHAGPSPWSLFLR